MKKGEILKSGDVVLPAPTSLTVSDEIIWTSDTGRTLSGTMVGDVVAEKKNLTIKWEFLTEEQVKVNLFRARQRIKTKYNEINNYGL